MARLREHGGGRWAAWGAVLGVLGGLLLQAMAPLVHRHGPHPSDGALISGGAEVVTHGCPHSGRAGHDGHDGHGHASDGAGPGPSAGEPADRRDGIPHPGPAPHDHDCGLCRLIAASQGTVPGVVPAHLVPVCEPPAVAVSGHEGRAGTAAAPARLARGPPLA